MASDDPIPPLSRLDRWLGGAPASRPGRSALAAAGGTGLLLGLCWALTYLAGGAGKVAPHWFYAPILLAASRFGPRGAVLTAAAAGLLAGPLMPLDVAQGTAQSVSDWGSRAGFFLGLGLLMSWVIARRRRAEGALEETRRAVGRLTARLRGEEAARARRERLAREVRGVLGGEGLRMAFQPIADLETGRVVGLEALARFPAGPRRAPDRWFTGAWEVGLGPHLEVAALRAALAALDRLPEGVFLAFNLSPDTLESRVFLDVLAELPCPRLVLEITEHAPVEDYEALAGLLAEFRGRGGRVAVDDAGAGFASLRHILRLAPDLIKLDVDLTRGIDGDPGRRALASGLIAFASEVGASIVAEGIETPGELEALRSLGVPYGQGFHLARPGPVPALDLSEVVAPRARAAGL